MKTNTELLHDAGALGDQHNDLEVSYWRDLRLYPGDSLNDLRQEWRDAGSPDPTPPHQMMFY